jgi:2-polyprenyl-3-methyl-5-hydroxy-6-metoxy-1,4-benzoquinol methylase
VVSVTLLPDFNDTETNPKNAPLTEADVEKYSCRPIIPRLLQSTADRLGKTPQELRILDYGCGRGELVAYLIRHGYDCYGVDIDPAYIENARSYFTESRTSLPVISPIENDRSIFDDGFFDVIITAQVLEHVRSIEPVVREIGRILAADGVCLHIFPPSLSVVEPHMFLPFVHWIPGNRFRRNLIHAMLSIGMGAPYFKEFSTTDRTRIFFEFSITDTFYRAHRELIRLFASHGFISRDIAREKLLHRGGTVSRVVAIPVIGRVAAWVYSTFYQTYVLTAKNAKALAL